MLKKNLNIEGEVTICLTTIRPLVGLHPNTRLRKKAKKNGKTYQKNTKI